MKKIILAFILIYILISMAGAYSMKITPSNSTSGKPSPIMITGYQKNRTAANEALAQQRALSQAQENRKNIVYNQMYNAARTSPGVGDVNVILDDAHIGVTISPGPYATSSDLANAVSALIIAYAGLLSYYENYTGYLRVGIASKAPNGQYLVTQIFEAPASETRAFLNGTELRLDYINYVLGKGKSMSYTYYVEGYPQHWP